MNLIERVMAATDWKFFAGVQQDISQDTTFAGVITKVISLILMVAGALAVIYLIYSGILYITAAGNPDAAKKGQQGIINAIIGIIIIVLAFVIASAVVNTTKQTFGS